MKLVTKAFLVVSIVSMGALSLAATPAPASFTCVGGTTCVMTFKADGTKAASTRYSYSIGTTEVTCAFSASTHVIKDGDSSIIYDTYALNDCTNNGGCGAGQPKITVAAPSDFAYTLSSSTKLGAPATSWPIAASIGAVTMAFSTCAFGTSGAITVPKQTLLATPSSLFQTPLSYTLSSTKASWTATGAPALIIGSSGTNLTITVILTSTTTPAGGLTVS